MAVSSQPQLYVNGVNLNNRFSLEVLWKQCEGLFDGAALEPGATLDTFDGKAKVRAHALAYQARRVVITGRIINRSGWLEKQAAIAELAETFAGRPAKLRIGTLELECEFGPVRLVDDPYSHLPGYQTWRVEGEAIPGTYASQYHSSVGYDQGLAVQDDRLDSSAVKFASNSFTYTNPGTAPTEAVVALTGTASTTYYLKGRGLRRVPLTTDSAGNAYIDEASGFLVYPGNNAIRVEDSAGSLASGVTAVNLYGTRPRFLGNAPTSASTQSATTNRMSEGPLLTPARTGSASYINTAGTLTTATDGQARIGVPYGTYSSTKAGLVLEGASTNLLTSNQATAGDTLGDTTGFATSGTTVSPGSTLSVETTASNVAQGSKSIKVVTTAAGAGQGVETSNTAAAANTAHTMQIRIKTTAGQQLSVRFRDNTNGVSNTQTITGTGSFETITATITTGATAVTSLTISVYTPTAVAATFYVDALKIEANPFPTSWCDGTRNADLCGIVAPHNELLHSHDLTQAATWIVSGMTQPTKSGDDNTVTFGSTAHHIYQAVTPSSVASTTRTAVARLKLGTLSGSILLRLLDQSGNVIASTTISTSSLSASEYRTFYVTGTAASDDTGLRVQLIGSSGTGTVSVRSLGLVQGSQPGIEVRTTDTAIPAPTSPALDPAWQQNGSIEFDVVPLALDTAGVRAINLFGGDPDRSAIWGPRFYSYAGTIGFQLNLVDGNGPTAGIGSERFASLSPTYSMTAGTKYRLKGVWYDYTIDGVRYMPMELWIDGVLVASQDVAALYGATEWAEIDPSKLVSDGNVYAAISAPSDGSPMLGYPDLPANAIPHT